jgi:hypothetical protein
VPWLTRLNSWASPLEARERVRGTCIIGLPKIFNHVGPRPKCNGQQNSARPCVVHARHFCVAATGGGDEVTRADDDDGGGGKPVVPARLLVTSHFDFHHRRNHRESRDHRREDSIRYKRTGCLTHQTNPDYRQ